MEAVCHQPFRRVLGKISRIFPDLMLRIVEGRARFQKKLSGKVVVGREVHGLKHVSFAGKNAVGFGSHFSGEVKVGYATTVGAFNHVVGPVSIGNYCQLGPAVAIYGREHSTRHVTTYFNQSLFEGRLKQNAITDETRIGHDVWLGHGAVVLKGVQIGSGSVIGAGAIVTKDVPSYAVAVGNPARVVRMRFDHELIDLLTESQWWLKSAEELQGFENLYHLDLLENRTNGIELLQEMIRKAGCP
jgi:acetyltransferase-like isoleucine patch superfamily enzyme